MLGPNRFIAGAGEPVPSRVTRISCAGDRNGSAAISVAKPMVFPMSWIRTGSSACRDGVVDTMRDFGGERCVDR
jgi:hypothetical protein